MIYRSYSVNDNLASQNYQMKIFMEILADSFSVDSGFESDLLFSLPIEFVE